MLPKPDSCRGCPFYQTGQGFVPDEVKPGADVMVIGQNPGAEEEAQGVPFVGKTGQMMEAKFFPLAGIDRSRVSIGNAIRCRLKGANELPPLDLLDCRTAVEHCTRAHLRVPDETNLVVAQGAFALYATTGHGWAKYDKITDWRGWLLPFRPLGAREILSSIYVPKPGQTSVLATPHLAAIFRDPSLQHPAKYDWTKVARVLAGKWPEPMPRIQFEPPTTWPSIATFDTEFVPETGKLIRYSIGWRNLDGEPHVHVVEAGNLPARAKGCPTIIMHSAGADIDYLDQLLESYDIEETMFAHAVLWSDLDHDLGFLGSLYARINRWKHIERTSPLIYSGADALGTWDAWQALKAEFVRDPLSEQIYRRLQLPLVHVIRRATDVGLRVNRERAKRALVELEEKCDDAEAMAQAAVGWPMNLGSGPQVTTQLYSIERVHETARRHRA